MKVLISADMEGTCGVTSWVQVTPPEYGGEPTATVEYERARLRLTREVNAAVEGALAGGAEEVIVNESHDGMRNLIAEELHPSIRFITGNDKELGMVQGIQEEGVGALFFTGYHAKAGTPNAPLAHTWTGYVNDVRIDGRSTGEFGINALVAGHFGVPVTLVTGAEEAMRRVASAQPWRPHPGFRVEVDFDHQARADQCVYIPGVERGGERTVVYSPLDGLAFAHTFRAIMRASGIKFSP